MDHLKGFIHEKASNTEWHGYSRNSISKKKNRNEVTLVVASQSFDENLDLRLMLITRIKPLDARSTLHSCFAHDSNFWPSQNISLFAASIKNDGGQHSEAEGGEISHYVALKPVRII